MYRYLKNKVSSFDKSVRGVDAIERARILSLALGGQFRGDGLRGTCARDLFEG